MRNIFRVSPHALVVTDTRGTVFDCNDAALRTFGFKSVDEVVGLCCFDFVSEKYLERAMENWVERINSGTLELFEYELLRSDGHKFRATVSGSVMSDGLGKLTGFVLSVKDVTERNEVKDHSVVLNNALEDFLIT